MDIEKKLFGIGLPRTGATSLAEALRILNYKDQNYCFLTNTNTSDKTENSRLFQIDNSYFKVYQQLFSANNNSKFILTTRNNSSWKKSMSRSVYDRNLLPHVSKYRKDVESFFNKNNAKKQLLIIDLFELSDEEKWKTLCNFLEIKNTPVRLFPHINIRLPIGYYGQ